MTELINKWDVVNKLIQLENNYQFYKEQWDADVLYRRICELEIGIGKTPGVTVQQWIPVSERLPDEDTEVLTYRKGGISIELLHDGVWGDDDVEYAPYKVTHWMPLPEPPHEVASGKMMRPPKGDENNG